MPLSSSGTVWQRTTRRQVLCNLPVVDGDALDLFHGSLRALVKDRPHYHNQCGDDQDGQDDVQQVDNMRSFLSYLLRSTSGAWRRSSIGGCRSGSRRWTLIPTNP